MFVNGAVQPSHTVCHMELNADLVRFVLGLKLKALRQQRGLTLQDVASRAGLSVSYLSEIEKGKKNFPNPTNSSTWPRSFPFPTRN